MKVMILGGGVIGVTSAWYLLQAGHEVTVIERREDVSLETSFANAGQLSFGYSNPWAAPGVPLKAIKWLFEKHAPLAIRPTSDCNQYRFMWHMLRNCTTAQYKKNKGRMERISEYSRACINQLVADTGIAYEGRSQGLTQLFRTQAQVEGAQKDIQVLQEHDVPCKLLNVDEIIQQEPGLADARHKLAGALYMPHDQTGDCHIFTQKLARMAQEGGVDFRFNTNVDEIQHAGGQVTGVRIGDTIEKADAYVVALGVHSPLMLAPLGLRVPVYPLKGYSITVPIAADDKAPQSTVMDETHKVAITRFEQRIRVGGMAELEGYNHDLKPSRQATLKMVLTDLFAGGGNMDQVEFWTGLRPATPDGTPIIGKTPFKNLYTNTGHGTLGWTMSTGSAKYLADIISGQPTEINREGLNIFRYLH